MESDDQQPPVDDLVDHLLRDQDYLLAREIRHKAEELNQLFVQAQRQRLKVEAETSVFDAHGGGNVVYIDVRLFKQI